MSSCMTSLSCQATMSTPTLMGWCQCIMSRYHVNTCCQCFMSVYDVMDSCHCLMPWYHVSLCSLGRMSGHHVSVWCHGMISIYAARAWCQCMMSGHDANVFQGILSVYVRTPCQCFLSWGDATCRMSMYASMQCMLSVHYLSLWYQCILSVYGIRACQDVCHDFPTLSGSAVLTWWHCIDVRTSY